MSCGSPNSHFMHCSVKLFEIFTHRNYKSDSQHFNAWNTRAPHTLLRRAIIRRKRRQKSYGYACRAMSASCVAFGKCLASISAIQLWFVDRDARISFEFFHLVSVSSWKESGRACVCMWIWANSLYRPNWNSITIRFYYYYCYWPKCTYARRNSV